MAFFFSIDIFCMKISSKDSTGLKGDFIYIIPLTLFSKWISYLWLVLYDIFINEFISTLISSSTY
jgi:hypothetical protein